MNYFIATCEALVGTYSLSPFFEEFCDLDLVFPCGKGEADSISDEVDKADLRRFRLPKSQGS